MRFFKTVLLTSIFVFSSCVACFAQGFNTPAAMGVMPAQGAPPTPGLISAPSTGIVNPIAGGFKVPNGALYSYAGPVFAGPGNESSTLGSTMVPGSPQFMQQMNGLPPTTLDSFVQSAGTNAEFIYGDEGTGVYTANGLAPDPGLVTSANSNPLAPTPYMGFNQANRIGYGIATSNSNLGLTTGHGSYLPSAWGYDEMILAPGTESPLMPGGEWTQSGPMGSLGIFENNFGSMMGSLGSFSSLIP